MMETAPSSPRPNRVPWVLLLVLCWLWLGFIAGMIIGGRFFVPAGSGLAGPAIAFVYGVGGTLLGAVLAALLSWKLPARPLRLAALGSTLLAGVATALLVLGVIKNAVERHAGADSKDAAELLQTGGPSRR